MLSYLHTTWQKESGGIKDDQHKKYMKKQQVKKNGNKTNSTIKADSQFIPLCPVRPVFVSNPACHTANTTCLLSSVLKSTVALAVLQNSHTTKNKLLQMENTIFF